MAENMIMTTKTRTCLKNTIMSSILISIFAQIYIYPFNSRFVLGIGVIAIGFTFSIIDNIYPIVTGIMAGILTALMRSVGLALFSSTDTHIILIDFLPAIIFYIIYGFLGTIFPLVKKDKSMINLYFHLVCFDITSNIAEIMVRGMISISIIKIVIITALVRSIIQCIAILIYNYQKLYIKKSEHQKRYAELNLMVSKIYAEAFYLQKSTNDLNNVMKEAYTLYEISREEKEFSTKALAIAQNVHEIRKNNDRVLKGINQLVENVQKAEYMLISEIFSIISDNTKRQIQMINPNIYIEFHLDGDCSIKRYYDIFAILNNLIINAIEACDDKNAISIFGQVLKKELVVIVSDDGPGIEDEIIPYIFNIGFSTKFNKDTGAMSTGIGLCHVKNLIDNLRGNIVVESRHYRGTKFTISIPISNL